MIVETAAMLLLKNMQLLPFAIQDKDLPKVASEADILLLESEDKMVNSDILKTMQLLSMRG